MKDMKHARTAKTVLMKPFLNLCEAGYATVSADSFLDNYRTE